MEGRSIAAIIISYNSQETIKETINSIMYQVDMVIVVDNNSDNLCTEILSELVSRSNKLKVIYLSENKGIASALNIGIREAMNNNLEYIVTLDHDSICCDEFVGKMLSQYKEMELTYKDLILAPDVIDKSSGISKYERLSDSNKLIKVEGLMQSGCVFNVRIFQEIGYFNEDLFIYYVDDEFCKRVASVEGNCFINRDVYILHNEGKHFSKKIFGKQFELRTYSGISLYYISRNCIYMCKQFSYSYFRRIIEEFRNTILFSKNRRKDLFYMYKGMKDGFKSVLGKMS
ncbi:glycosyltransferase [Inconstantimicrobium mannanitabidum]|uniref:Rhamnosyltransferase n=1 Tax=Inconstantimicrobium mannanitabidum TaxID=1604901 RepID=A0ACB5RDX2_9CLOT|nr:glycosyltransferase [Clostridium sp. TW13]GKX67462.1 rhamnosyltransferase [Clostridium sp. TW13]